MSTSSISATQSTSQSLFAYDKAGRLLGRNPNPANITDATETVWLGNMPIAVIESGATYYIHSVFLNTPRQVDYSGQQAVWAWEPVAFGANEPNVDPLNTGNKFYYMLRFPGQVAGEGEELKYNCHRDYDSATGRYVESDLIGLRGGINTYAYVRGNPVSYKDPLGLCPPSSSKEINLTAGQKQVPWQPLTAECPGQPA